MKQTVISRRVFSQGALAGLGLCLTGCDTEATSQPPSQVTPLDSAPKFQDRGHRVYIVQPDAGPDFTPEILQTLNPQPKQVIGVRQAFEKQHPLWNYFVWASSDEAEKLAQQAGVGSVVEKQSKDVCEIGDPQTANGMVAVRFLPNSEFYPGSDETSATVPQIIQQWHLALRDVDGVVINPAPEPEAPIEVGEVPETHQAVILFTTPVLESTVLQLVKKHPQTMYLKWGGLFTSFYCPPCGMG